MISIGELDTNFAIGDVDVKAISLGDVEVWPAYEPLQPVAGVDFRFDTHGTSVRLTIHNYDTDIQGIMVSVVGGTETGFGMPPGGGSYVQNITQTDPKVPVEVTITASDPKVYAVFSPGVSLKGLAIDGSRLEHINNMCEGSTRLLSYSTRDMVQVKSSIATFKDCTSLSYVVPFSTSHNSNLTSMFENCTSLKEYPYVAVAGKTSVANFLKGSGVEHVPDINFYATADYDGFLEDCIDLESVGRITDTSGAAYNTFFKNCSSLTCIRGITTTVASTDMFTGCISLTSPDGAKQALLSAGGDSWSEESCVGDIQYLTPEDGTDIMLYINTSAHIYVDIKFDIDVPITVYSDLGNGVFTEYSKGPGLVSGFGGAITGNGPVRIKVSGGNITNLIFNNTYADNLLQVAIDGTRIDSFNQLCRSQKYLKSFTAINTSHITDMYMMLDGTAVLENLDVDTSSTTDMGYFLSGSGLADISALDFSSAIEIKAAFFNMQNIVTVGDITAPNAVAANSLFQDCHNLQNVGTVTLAASANQASMFRFSEALICVKGLNTTTATATGNMFLDCVSLTSPGSANQTLIEAGLLWDDATCNNTPTIRFKMVVTSAVQPTHTPVGGTLKYTDNGDGTWDATSTGAIEAITASDKTMTEVVIVQADDLNNITSAWKDCTALTAFDAGGLGNVTEAGSAWYGCIALTTFNTSSLTSLVNAHAAWRNCTSFTTFNAEGLTSVRYATFSWFNCTGLTSFDASGLTNVANLGTAWQSCANLICISSMTAPTVNVTDTFLNTPALTAPSPAEQTAHFTTSGTTWVNSNACP